MKKEVSGPNPRCSSILYGNNSRQSTFFVKELLDPRASLKVFTKYLHLSLVVTIKLAFAPLKIFFFISSTFKFKILLNLSVII